MKMRSLRDIVINRCNSKVVTVIQDQRLTQGAGKRKIFFCRPFADSDTCRLYQCGFSVPFNNVQREDLKNCAVCPCKVLFFYILNGVGGLDEVGAELDKPDC